MTKRIAAKVLVAEAIYISLPSHPDRVREITNSAEQAMSELASHDGQVLCETPRLVDQRATGLGHFELMFEAETVKR